MPFGVPDLANLAYVNIINILACQRQFATANCIYYTVSVTLLHSSAVMTAFERDRWNRDTREK